MALTTHGFPYAQPADSLVDWPAVSQDLAELLEAHQPFRVTAAQFAALVPADGMEVYLEANAAAGVIWHLRYNAGSASAYKWEVVGSARPLFSEVTTNENVGSVAYANAPTPGPSIVVPRAGDYDVTIGADLSPDSAAVGQVWMGYDIGATPAVDADSITSVAIGGGVQINSSARKRRKAALAAGVTLLAKYRGNVATARPYSNRWMAVEPVRIS